MVGGSDKLDATVTPPSPTAVCVISYDGWREETGAARSDATVFDRIPVASPSPKFLLTTS